MEMESHHRVTQSFISLILNELNSVLLCGEGTLHLLYSYGRSSASCQRQFQYRIRIHFLLRDAHRIGIGFIIRFLTIQIKSCFISGVGIQKVQGQFRVPGIPVGDAAYKPVFAIPVLAGDGHVLAYFGVGYHRLCPRGGAGSDEREFRSSFIVLYHIRCHLQRAEENHA